MDNGNAVKRRLSAILAADAVGYSAHMAENEERTLRTLAGHRRVMDSLIADHGGRIVGTAGDSVLAEFGSSVEAVRCAVEIQDALATRNDSLPAPERLQFRIGINLGDVIVDGADILGDGVNVASRLEGIAEPGGICIASSVFDQISGKLNLGFKDIGERPLKNISRPVRAYRVGRADALAQAQPRSRASILATAGAAVVILAAAAGYFLVRGRDVSSPPRSRPASAPSAASSEASLVGPAQPSTPPPASAATRASAPASSQPLPQSRPALPARSEARPAVAAARGSSPEVPTQASTAMNTYTGGFVQARCQRRDGPPTLARGPVKVEAGEIIVTVGEPGQPGHVSLRGRPDPDGTLVLAGFVTPAAGRGRGARVAARFEGRLTNGRGMLIGNQGGQRCSVGVQLR